MTAWPYPTGINSNTPDQELFSMMVDDTCKLLESVNSLVLSACVFALGEKLAQYRNLCQEPDAHTVAELKAVYKTLDEQFGQSFFHGHANESFAGLKDSITDKQAVENQHRDLTITPPDVRVMIDLYNAVWKIHYEEFLKNPPLALADWNINDRYQTRAVRAVLFDMAYPELVGLCRVLLDAHTEGNDQDMPAKLRAVIEKKTTTVLMILAHRPETSEEVMHMIESNSPSENVALLKELSEQLAAAPKSAASHETFGILVSQDSEFPNKKLD